MPNYRIEISPNGRAGCQDSVCKAGKHKILKGEIRLGVWVEFAGSGIPASWKWRHWGCTSGEIIKHIQSTLDSNGTGEYNWDLLDGWEEIQANDEIREKVQRVIQQGHIDPEDFRGDPEFNKPGQKGIRGRASRKKESANDEDENQTGEPSNSQTVAEADNSKTAEKRSRKKVEVDEEETESDGRPIKKAKKAINNKRGADEGQKPSSERPKRGAGKKPVTYKEEDVSEGDEPRKRITRKKASATKNKATKKSVANSPVEADDETDEQPVKGEGEPDEPAVQNKRGRKAAEAKPQANKRARKSAA